MVKHLNRQFNIFHVAQSDRFVRLEMKLFKKLKSNMGKSVMSLVRSGMQESLLKSAVIIDDTAKGEKNKKDKDAIPAAIQGDHPSAKTIPSSEQIGESQGEKPVDIEIANKESTPPVSNDKTNEGKELVVHTSEEKKSEGIMSVEDD
ncbi:hypothetical protein Tco_0933627 [Tanacetum coccineum]